MLKQKLPISATILVKNAENTLKECLDSLQNFSEIILLDNISTDNTIKIAQEFNKIHNNLKIYTSEFIGFGALKNLAISYAKNEWIFSIDSDEVLEKDTLEYLTNLFCNNLPDSNTIFSLPRKNLYNGVWIKACGWHPDYVIRIFNKNYTKFNNNIVHESIILPSDSNLIKLNFGLKHYAYDNIAHLIQKMQSYSNLWAEQNTHKKSNPLKAIIHGSWTFIRNYFFKKGFLYGYKGFIISVCNGLGAFFKYMKLYEHTHTHTIRSLSLIITTYNQKERLSLVLDSVRDLAILPSEVLIADDGSKEDTKFLIESYAKNFPVPLKHIWQEDKGFLLSAIRNKAIKEASGEYIIIIDGDMILDPYFIEDHLNFAKPKVFLQGSRVILNEQNSQEILNAKKQGNTKAYKLAFSSKELKAKRNNLLANLIYKNSTINAKFFDKKDFIKGIRGCNMSFYKIDCEEINGFNEDFVGWGREDSEFVARFLFNGGQMRRLKFYGIAYHIYHQENTKAALESNHKIYLNTIATKAKYCQNGLKTEI